MDAGSSADDRVSLDVGPCVATLVLPDPTSHLPPCIVHSLLSINQTLVRAVIKHTHSNSLTMDTSPCRPATGIKVVIVGAGFAGIAAAIECDRKGHTPIVLEKASTIEDITRFGDIISFDPNGARHFERWPAVIEEMQKVAGQTT
jgi:hypothetical protein